MGKCCFKTKTGVSLCRFSKYYNDGFYCYFDIESLRDSEKALLKYFLGKKKLSFDHLKFKNMFDGLKPKHATSKKAAFHHIFRNFLRSRCFCEVSRDLIHAKNTGEHEIYADFIKKLTVTTERARILHKKSRFQLLETREDPEY